MKKKPIFEIRVNSWNSRTKREQEKVVRWLNRLIEDLVVRYRKTGISDDFRGISE